jgi:hypothetical protein
LPKATKGNSKEELALFQKEMALKKEVGEEFDNTIKADFINVNNEVLKRIGPPAAAAILRGRIFFNSATGTPLGMPSLTPDEWEAPFLCTYADQLEQMAKLLPSDSAKH